MLFPCGNGLLIDGYVVGRIYAREELGISEALAAGPKLSACFGFGVRAGSVVGFWNYVIQSWAGAGDAEVDPQANWHHSSCDVAYTRRCGIGVSLDAA
jgi:hypothetical protein